MPKVLNKRWAKPEELKNAVYVGRPTKWGNPYTHLTSKLKDVIVVESREQAVKLFKETISPELVTAAKRELKGRDLSCWCAPAPCHADILLEIANSD